MSNLYISELLNITKIQASRILNSLKKNGYIKIDIIYKEDIKEISLRKIISIYRNINTYKPVNTSPINTNVKEIIKINIKVTEIIVSSIGQAYMQIILEDYIETIDYKS